MAESNTVRVRIPCQLPQYKLPYSMRPQGVAPAETGAGAMTGTSPIRADRAQTRYRFAVERST